MYIYNVLNCGEKQFLRVLWDFWTPLSIIRAACYSHFRQNIIYHAVCVNIIFSYPLL